MALQLMAAPLKYVRVIEPIAETYLKRAYLESICLKVVEAVLCFLRKIIPVGDFMQFVLEGSHLLLLKSYASVTPGVGRPFF